MGGCTWGLGYGGSADTRTSDFNALGKSLLQHLHIGVLPSASGSALTMPDLLPLTDTMSNVMPESWVRAAILIRMNSLIRGHSAVRWRFIEALGELLENNIVPVVPLRGTISASGGKTVSLMLSLALGISSLLLSRQTSHPSPTSPAQ